MCTFVQQLVYYVLDVNTVLCLHIVQACVPLQKTVIWIARVTQPFRTLSAKPARVHSAVLCLPALGTVASLSLSGTGVVIDLHREVLKRKEADGGG